MENKRRLPVREITEFLLQSGSIDTRFGGENRAVRGSRLHRKLQKQEGPDYQAEVSFSLEIPQDDFFYTLEGRADGVFLDGDTWMVDEIKTTGFPLSMVDENFNAAHWGQAYCYAYMLAIKRSLSRVGVRLTYCQVDTEQLKRFSRVLTLETLTAYIHDLLKQYSKWVRMREDWQKIRNTSISGLPFPFPNYRAGQRNMAKEVYRTIRDKGRLFCQAPTGIGKTISALFPAVKALGEGQTDSILYLTAKTITRKAAEDAYNLLRGLGLRLKTLTLTAKDKVCFLEERECNPEACPYAAGYYDRVRDAVYTLLHTHDYFSRETLECAAREYRVCPFELSLDLSLWCDSIICDYNYVFDPIASLQRFTGNHTILIDEAHNLVDRAREMYSAPLVKSRFVELKKQLGRGHPAIIEALQAMHKHMAYMKMQCGKQSFLAKQAPDEALNQAVEQFCNAASEWLERHREASPLRTQLLERYWEAGFYLRILELYDEHFCTAIRTEGTEAVVTLTCLDPSALLDAIFCNARAAVLFSATLSPLPYYQAVLGGGAHAKGISLRSPFPQENFCLLSADHISTKYADRSATLQAVASLLYTMICAKPGNYLAYFPSYQYLSEVYGVFITQHPEVETVVQTGNMEEQAREDFLSQFQIGKYLFGFCVLGGIFGEGIDFQGDRLLGTAVVGVGLPQLGPERDLLRLYYDDQNGLGFAYAYQYPGMNKVLQAAGRVIRSANDRGVVLLIDSRFRRREYQCLFPSHWSHCRPVRSIQALAAALSDFWG